MSLFMIPDMGRLSWIIRVSPKSNHKSYEREAEGGLTQNEVDKVMELQRQRLK